MNVHLAKATRERLNKKMLCWSFVGLAPFNIEIQKTKAEKIIIATKTKQQFAIWLKKTVADRSIEQTAGQSIFRSHCCLVGCLVSCLKLIV